MDEARDPEALRSGQYAGAGNLRARMALHERFGPPGTSWQRWVFERLPATPAARVLELGCGPGVLWSENLERVPSDWRLTLSDLSEGMLTRAREALRDLRPQPRFVRFDATSLPFGAGDLDLVIANHMLYHVPDLPRTLREIRRVLAPGGTLVAATNGRAHMAELHALVRATAAEVPGETPPAARARGEALAFELENGRAWLDSAFGRVEIHRREEPLRVTEGAPVVDYVASMGPVPEAFLAALERRVEAILAERGTLVIRRSTGLFVAR